TGATGRYFTNSRANARTRMAPLERLFAVGGSGYRRHQIRRDISGGPAGLFSALCSGASTKPGRLHHRPNAPGAAVNYDLPSPASGVAAVVRMADDLIGSGNNVAGLRSDES